MSDLTPFATKAELASFWRSLNEDEAARADTLLTIASNRLRLIARNIDVDLDVAIEDDAIYSSNLQYVVMEAVKRALLTPQDSPPVETFQQTAGPYSENLKYANPAGDLFFKNSELSTLGLYGSQTLSSIITTREDIYS